MGEAGESNPGRNPQAQTGGLSEPKDPEREPTTKLVRSRQLLRRYLTHQSNSTVPLQKEKVTSPWQSRAKPKIAGLDQKKPFKIRYRSRVVGYGAGGEGAG